jgi:hypothetical protein
VKALSLRQPWANAVLYLGKNLENRRWNTRFRGNFLLHAAKGMTRDEYEDAVSFSRNVLHPGDDPTAFRETAFRVLEAFGQSGHASPVVHRLERGGIVGVATLVSVLLPCASEPTLFWRPCAHPWHMREQYGFVLDDIRPTPFVPCRGALGFFDVDEDVVAKALARV